MRITANWPPTINSFCYTLPPY